MNKSLITGLVVGAVIVTAGAAIGGRKLFNRGPEYAVVTNVEPVMKTVSTPREHCTDVPITETAPTRDPKQVTGTVIGAVVGGVVGNQVGSGRGRDIATVAGAAAGGYAGNRIQKRTQENNTVTRTEQRCETVYDKHKERIGYDVTYKLEDETHTVRMDHDPGERIPVKDGKIVLAQN